MIMTRKKRKKLKAKIEKLDFEPLEKQNKNVQLLEHQLEEWKSLNEYLNAMDMGYYQSLVITVSIFAVVVAVFTSDIVTRELFRIIFIVPLGIVAVFSYLSYQFRITAILRGHLAALEEKMNAELGENVHMWNSALVEVYMAHNNSINNFMMVPIMVFIIVLTMYCIYFTRKILVGIPYAKLIFWGYWMLVFVGATIVFYPFLTNEKIRHETYNEEHVMNLYERYKAMRNDKRNKKNIWISICLTVLNLTFGFGVMFIFWIIMKANQNLKGLFDFYAATIGDGIFLSAFLGTGCYYILSNKDYLDGKNKWINKISLIGACIGTLMQISWLISDNTVLNWTIDRIHHFNIVGWYHAFYFVVMFYFITNIFIKAICVNNKGLTQKRGFYILMWISGLGYWFTHIIDDYLTSENYMNWIIGSVVVYWIAFFICEGGKIKEIKKYKMLYVGEITGSIVLAGLTYTLCMVGGLDWSVLQLFKNINEWLR